jgi:hypothetical protein
MTSTDGITWTAQASNPTNSSWMAVTYGDGKFVAVSNSGSGNRAMVISTTPPVITLSSNTGTVTAGSPLSPYTINSTGGVVTGYSISPNISTTPGLAFDTSTGLMSGTPTTAATVVTYTITARNTDGVSTATYALTVNPASAPDNSAAQAAAQAEAARKAREQQELIDILALIPKIGELTLSLGETTKSLYSTKCVKGKSTKFVKKGAKCPKGFARK